MKKYYQHFVVSLLDRKFHVKAIDNPTQAKKKKEKKSSILTRPEPDKIIFANPQLEKSPVYFIPNPKIFNPL